MKAAKALPLSSPQASDRTFYALKALSWLGLIWDVRTPPRHVLEGKALSG